MTFIVIIGWHLELQSRGYYNILLLASTSELPVTYKQKGRRKKTPRPVSVKSV